MNRFVRRKNDTKARFNASVGVGVGVGVGRRGAFTLIEVMVIVIVIGVIASIAIPTLFSNVGKAKGNVAKQRLASVEQAIHLFNSEYGRFPATLDELVTRPGDIEPEKWSEPTLKAKDLEDPWGNPWQYAVPGEHGVFDLSSQGADGAPGGEGENADVVNW